MKATGIARGLGVTAPQAQKWLNLLVKDGTLEKSKRPARYSVLQTSRSEREGAIESDSDGKPAGSGR